MGKARVGKHLLVAAALTAGLLPIGSVEAHVTADDSTVTRAYDNGRFHGQVKGDPPRCRRDRQVAVFKVRDGDDKFIDSDTTNVDGVWSFPQPNANGTFYAVVGRDVNGRYGHSHVCRSDRSPNISV